MNSLLLIPAAGAVVLVVHLFASLIHSIRSPLKTVPGPFLARFTDGWYFWAVRQGRFDQQNQEIHQKYGPVVRYGPNRYSINDPHAAKIIYGLGAQFAKSSWYSTWGAPGQWTIFSDQSIKHHSQTRRLYQGTYSMTALVNYEPYVDQCNDLFAQRLTEMALSDVSIDMGHWFQCYAFDVIGMITYGRRLGFLDRGDDIGGVMGALEDHMRYATLTGIFPSLHRYLYSLKNYWAGAKGAGRAYVLSFTKERIREHQTTPKAVPEAGEDSTATVNFLSKFLTKHTDDPDAFTSYHVLTGCSANMVAGSDTTAISLSAILYYLLKNPQCMQRLRDEIKTCEEQGNLSKFPTFQESQKMPYLQAIIKEALRMHPATGLPLERVVPEGGATIAGHYFPEGTVVGINTWVEHRDPRYFGNDADVFRPERWLDEDSDRISVMNRHWMPFGLGSRSCIGRHVSMLEISKLVPRLIRDFEFSLNKYSFRDGSWQTDGFWFVKPREFKVHAKVREGARSG
ncbi:cytochrome P450 [Dactylonectria macrodidyma]|uniref:Cytochrome P450 n=1 Tax=Dactylonectria macrodidyma TaxID=307937 RepID=A0A9P9E4I5_9HYPO|nr:cytochrome P450 [Dactylonectria macrodidyma]